MTSRALCVRVAATAVAAAHLAPLEAAAQTLIDWSLATPPISGGGTLTFTGPVPCYSAVTWTLQVTGADAVSVPVADPQLLRGTISGATSTYSLTFSAPVVFSWWNDSLGASLGGLSVNQESVTILGGSGSYALSDNSNNITPTLGANSYPPVLTSSGGNLTAGWNAAGDHAYYRSVSIGPRTTLTWTHTTVSLIKSEGWRVEIECADIDFGDVSGNGVFVGSTANDVHWEATVSGADGVGPQGGAPWLLRGVIGGVGTSATYRFAFDRPVYVALSNHSYSNVGGLAGLDALSNELIDVVGGAGTFELVDNSANITPVPGASSVPPVISTQGDDLRAESASGIDHAYYRVRSLAPVESITWTHDNAVAKAEAWRLAVYPVQDAEPVPLASPALRIVLGVMLVGASRWLGWRSTRDR